MQAVALGERDAQRIRLHHTLLYIIIIIGRTLENNLLTTDSIPCSSRHPYTNHSVNAS